MGVKILFSSLWTYNINIMPKDRKGTENRQPICFLNGKEYTHIHGDLQIIINEKTMPYMGISSKDDVCFGYWIEMIAEMLKQFKSGNDLWIIQGEEQGKPAYQFDLIEDEIYLSIIDSPLGGKKDSCWQKVPFKLSNFSKEFIEFEDRLLEEIQINAPNELENWSSKFNL